MREGGRREMEGVRKGEREGEKGKREGVEERERERERERHTHTHTNTQRCKYTTLFKNSTIILFQQRKIAEHVHVYFACDVICNNLCEENNL